MQKAVLAFFVVGLMGTACGDDGPPAVDAAVVDTRDQPDTRLADMRLPDEDAGECDEDGDGFDAAHCGGRDCDDNDPYRFPGNPERCSGVLPDGREAAGHDEDCNPCTFTGAGVIDGDADADRYLAMTCSNAWPGDSAPIGCDPTLSRIDEIARVVSGTDCADDNPDVHPNQPEICGDGLDNNCDGGTDMGTLYRDLDNDGRGDPEVMMTGACALGWVLNDEDCNDDQALVYQGAPELCDRLDNDCSMGGGVDASEDMDEDGHAPDAATCIPLGEASGAQFPIGDCNDEDPTTYLGAPEICGDGIDNNCNRTIDDAMPRICPDVDRDGFGDPDRSTWTFGIVCAVPDGWTSNCGTLGGLSFEDCDDHEALRNPEATEWCNGVNDNCDAVPGAAEDGDGDRHSARDAICDDASLPGAPSGTYLKDDCNDGVNAIHPGAVERCDRMDSDCSEPGDGTVSLGEDRDDDGFAPLDADCSGGFPATDCDDENSAINPGAVDAAGICDGLDNDCNPRTEERTGICDEGGYCGPNGVCARALSVVAIDSGDAHSCVLHTGGTVWCWGRSVATGSGPTFQAQATLTEAIALSTAGNTSCATRRDGSVWCWGETVGLGTFTTPTRIPGISDSQSVIVGGEHTCVLRYDGTVACWGANGFGQLGDGTNLNRSAPVTAVGLVDVIELSLGENHTCALTQDGRVLCWGSGGKGQLGMGGMDVWIPTRVGGLAPAAQVSAGALHTCVVLRDGGVRCFGLNQNGELGDGTQMRRDFPVPVMGVSSAERVALGIEHSCAMLRSGRVQCWGNGEYGALGNDDLSDRVYPTPVDVLNLSTAQHISAGLGFSCSARDSGDISCWGNNFDGRLGDRSLRPSSGVPTAGIRSYPFSFGLGARHSCTMLDIDRVSCWGGNPRGQLGTGTTSPELRTDQPLGGLSKGLAVITAGIGHTCALTGAQVSCWGAGTLGQLTGFTDSLLPRRSASMFGSEFGDIYAGQYHSCMNRDGFLSCWGANSSGQLGDGSTTNRGRPRPIYSGVADAGLGGSHSCALLDDGQVYCWGGNEHLQLGEPRGNALTPIPRGGFGTVTSLAVGGAHSCVVSEGSVFCWGANEAGQLGLGDTVDHVPEKLPLRDVTSVHAGRAHTCALLEREVWCWGAGGAVGDGTVIDRLVPTLVPGLSDTVVLWTGAADHTCARSGDGTTRCWGANNDGQLGLGHTDPVLTPQVVWAF